MIAIGIDPSMNSTGICVKQDLKTKYYIVTSHMTKKMVKFDADQKNIKYLPYEKTQVTGLEYAEKETAKANNVYNICQQIKATLKKHKPDIVVMEGVSYGSIGSAALVDLAGLQFAIRMVLIDLKIPFKIVTPMHLKSVAVGIGSADKAIMVDAWKRLDAKMNYNFEVKVDDLADAFFLARCAEEEGK